MTGGVEVETNALGRAGKQMQLAAQGAEKGNPSDDLAGIGKAIPGSLSAAAATTLSTTWGKRFTRWKTDAGQNGTDMIDSADTYVASDSGAADRHGQKGGTP